VDKKNPSKNKCVYCGWNLEDIDLALVVQILVAVSRAFPVSEVLMGVCL